MSEPVLVVRVICRLGSEQTHVADVHPDQFCVCEFVTEFTGVALPVVTRCGAVLRDRAGVAVCMEPGTKVRCARCRRVSGIAEASADNDVMPSERVS